MPDQPDFKKAYEVFKDDPTRKDVVRQWEGEWRRAALDKNLYEHAAVAKLVEQLQKFVVDAEIKMRDQKIATTSEMFFIERARLEAERNCWSWLLHIFTKAEAKMDTIASTVGKVGT